MIKFIKRLFCRHKQQTFVRNIFGDEIIYRGWKRSEWKCDQCGASVLQNGLKRGVDGCPD